jgi:hypothetical protein
VQEFVFMSRNANLGIYRLHKTCSFSRAREIIGQEAQEVRRSM